MRRPGKNYWPCAQFQDSSQALAPRSGLESGEHVYGVHSEGRDRVPALENEDRGKTEPGDASSDLEIIVARQKKVRDGVFLVNSLATRNAVLV